MREPLLQPWLTAHSPAGFVAAVLVFAISLAPWWTARLSQRIQPLVVLLGRALRNPARQGNCPDFPAGPGQISR
jgi:hypothetical protein